MPKYIIRYKIKKNGLRGEIMRYWAVQAPEQYRGVYTNKNTIAKIQKQMNGLKGCKVKVFKSEKGHTAEEALKWAGISKLEDNDTIPTSNKESTKNSTEIKQITTISDKVINRIKKSVEDTITTKILPTIKSNTTEDFKELIRFFSKSTDVLEIHMLNGNHYYITINDCWYTREDTLPELEYFTKCTYSDDNNMPTYDIDDDTVKSYIHKVGKLSKTHITYQKNYLIIKNFDIHGPKKMDFDSFTCYKHEYEDTIAINTNNIESIQPTNWDFENRAFYKYKNVLKKIITFKKEAELNELI